MGGSRALAVAGIASASAGFALIALAISGRGDGLKREVLESRPRMMDVGGGQKGYGPLYYGDMNLYGASVGRDGMAQPYPLYQDYTFAQSGEPVGPDAIRLPRPSKEYMEGYRKDFNSYFENGAEKIPDPIDAGYWPYKTADGLEARGRAGEAGKLLRSWVAMDSMASDAPLGKGGDDVSKEEYIDQEADAAYQNDMRFYTNDDWP